MYPNDYVLVTKAHLNRLTFFALVGAGTVGFVVGRKLKLKTKS